MAQKVYTFEIINEGTHEIRVIVAETKSAAEAQLPANCTIKTTSERSV